MSLVEVIEKLSETAFRPLKPVKRQSFVVDSITPKVFYPEGTRPYFAEIYVEGNDVLVEFGREPDDKTIPLNPGIHVYLLNGKIAIYMKAVSGSAVVKIRQFALT